MLKNILKVLAVLSVVGVSAAAVTKVVSKRTTQQTTVSQTFTPALSQIPTPSVQVVKRKVVSLHPDPEQTIIFNTPFDQVTVELAIDNLEQMVNKGYTDAYLILDSPGGSVLDGAKLISYMRNGPIRVHTVCDGMCASMAAHTFSAGHNRYMTDKSVLMFHPASGGVRGTLEQMSNQLNMFKLYVDRLDAFAANRAGVDYNTFKSRIVSELWLETEDALNEKFADNLAFISYSRKTEQTFNMENYLKIKKIAIPKYKDAAITLE